MNVNHPPIQAVREAVSRALAEDLLPMGDLTASLLPPDTRATASFVTRAPGVVAGELCVAETFTQIDPSISVSWVAEDGTEVREGDLLGTVTGALATILMGERTALNFLVHLSGVATITNRYVRAAHDRLRVLDTRKTTPGLRALEKAAVRAGGGVNHRGSLSEAVLIKDNHLLGLSITDAVRRAKLRWPLRLVEIECDRVEQVIEAVEAGAGMILLDNMAPDVVAECVTIVEGRCLLEASGGITLETIGRYAETGVDFVSVGALTHSAPGLDIGLDIASPTNVVAD